jgi:SpoVK/Ycf46/Vps4 family AAA+-type ATPase
VLFVDEAEKAFSAAGAASGGDSGTSARVLGELLSWLQDKTAPVFVVLTCNEPDLLPTALLRKGRFDEIFAVGLPGPVARAEILRIHWQVCGQSYEQSIPPELRAQALRDSRGFSGGELEVACQAAFIEAFWQNRSPTAADLLKALRRTVPLSQTLKEQVMLLEAWCKSGRAVPAASPDTGEAEQQAAVLDIPSA